MICASAPLLAIRFGLRSGCNPCLSMHIFSVNCTVFCIVSEAAFSRYPKRRCA